MEFLQNRERRPERIVGGGILAAGSSSYFPIKRMPIGSTRDMFLFQEKENQNGSVVCQINSK